MREYHILNLGAGIQSTALYLMSLRRDEPEHVPVFDAAIFADTQEEPRAVYEHVEWLKSLGGPPILEATAGKLGDDLTKVLDQETWDRQLAIIAANASLPNGQKLKCPERFTSIPAYCAVSQGKKDGISRRQCTREYKIEVVEQVIRRQILGLEPRQHMPKDVRLVQYLGLSLDEPNRIIKTQARFLEGSRGEPRFPLFDMRMDRGDCESYLKEVAPDRVVPRSACVFCLTGDTEVITPVGERPIRDLVGMATLLVPAANGQTYRNHGVWRDAEVRSFGVQPVVDVVMVKGRATKVVRATLDHRWVLAGQDGFVPTSGLKPGDRLESCFRPSVKSSGPPVKPSPFGIAHGFVFGDGTVEAGNRPANVVFYADKDYDLLPYFQACDIKPITANGKTALRARGLPRTWKDVPPLDESRCYLLGWLAGYFAADGTVPKSGKQAVIYSSVRSNIAFVRAVCYHLGVKVSPIGVKTRVGFGKETDLYSASLCVKDLPDSFWLLGHHRERVLGREQQGESPFPNWVVREVSGVVGHEEVFCAVVPGAERFTLADNLLTGNCPFRRNHEWVRLRDTDPEGWERACQVDEAMRAERAICTINLDDKLYLHESCVPLREAAIDTPVSPMDRFLGNFIMDCEGLCGN